MSESPHHDARRVSRPPSGIYLPTPSRASSSSSHQEFKAKLPSGAAANAGNHEPDGDDANRGSVRRRGGARHSGGFLLDSGVFDAPRPGAKNVATSIGVAGKGKSKSKERGTASARISKNIGEEERKSTIGGSPLANEVRIQDATRQSTVPSMLQGNGREATHTSTYNEHQRPPSSFDSDPAQIVSLALNLSENRRRQFSNGRLSSLDAAGNRRLVSTPRIGTAVVASPVVGGSLRHHLNLQKKHRNESLTPERTTATTDYFSTFQQEPEPRHDADTQPPLLPGIDFGALVSPQFNPTDATLARAEKARVTIGLNYQHRRLLQYLPKLPATSGNRSSLSRGGPKYEPEKSPPLGRAYNPLQYLRNRRVRVRESKSLNSEADGWKDLERVEKWVEAVAGERKDRVSKVDDKYPLPHFKDDRAETVPEISYLSSNTARAGGPLPAKPPRQRTDWNTAPWDLLGDVYWLSQDDHHNLIEDRDGNKIFNLRNSLDISGLTREATGAFYRRSASITRRPKVRSESSEPPGKSGKDETAGDRGRKRHQPHDSIKSIHEYSSSRDRKTKWSRKLIRAQSVSSSDESEHGSAQGAPGTRGRPTSRDLQAGALLELQVRELLAKEEASTEEAAIKEKEEEVKRDPSPTVSTLDPQHYSTATGDVRASPANKIQDGDGAAREKGPHRHGHRPTQSMDYLDSSVPNSPDNRAVVPSIAINLSPPSRGPSSHKRHSLPQRSIMGEFEKGVHKVQTTDFASIHRPSHKLQKSRSPEPAKERRGIQPGGLLSPDRSGISARLKRGFGEGRASNSHSEPKEARIRGLLKGARLSDVVSNPVSKVRDLNWRKDDASLSRPQSPVSSYESGASETDEERGSGNGGQYSGTRTGISNQQPTYHLDNLPVFRSPFKANGGADSNAPEHDHITRQQQSLRAQRSRRFEKLAPPSLDMRSLSSQEPSPPSTPTDGKNGFASDDSRRPSGGDRRFAVVEGSPDVLGRQGYPVTGKSDPTLSAGSPDQWDHGQHSFSVADLNLTLSNDRVTGADVARVTALLVSTATKASEVVRIADSSRTPPLPLLGDLALSAGVSDWRVPRRLEQAKISQLLAGEVDKDITSTRAAVNAFSNETVNGFHEQLRDLEGRVSKHLTGLVRAAADRADDLGSEVATTDTLKVKRLNESVDLIMRRRRRRFRNLRRGVYLLLEWTLLGLMWWVWLIVVVVRLARGLLSGSYQVIRWLLWL